MDADARPDPTPDASKPVLPHLRLTGVFGALTAAILVAAYFTPWIRIDPARLDRMREAVEDEMALRTDPSRAAKDYERLAQSLIDQHAITGVDVIFWTRTALDYRREIEADAVGASSGTLRMHRGIVLFGIALASVPLSALLLALYFLRHRFRRARSPALILSLLTGVLAVALAGIYEFALGPMSPNVHPGIGLSLLLGSGAGFVMVAIFGVTTRNWWRVYGGALVTGMALGICGYVYLYWGIAP